MEPFIWEPLDTSRDQWPATDDRRPATGDRRPATHWWGSNVTLRDSPLRVFTATPPACDVYTSCVCNSRRAPSSSELMIGDGAARREKKGITACTRSRDVEKRSPIMRIDFATETNSSSTRYRSSLRRPLTEHRALLCILSGTRAFALLSFHEEATLYLSHDRSLMRRDKCHTSATCQRNKCVFLLPPNSHSPYALYLNTTDFFMHIASSSFASSCSLRA